jgi:dTDP-4-amino-4,6-dideoxygalactose transaminase
LHSLRSVHDLVKARMERIALYRARLGSLSGCWVQEYPDNRTTSGNYFVLFITDRAKASRDAVYESLKQAGIQTKRYFYPPLHEQAIFQKFPMKLSARLSQTQHASRAGLALPLYCHMPHEEIDMICARVQALLA